MNGYEIESWHDFFVAQAGAGAALTGLIFVAISINLSKLLAQKAVSGRAVEALLLLVSLLIVGLLALIPGQGMRALGIEVIGFGIILSGCVAATNLGADRKGGATPAQHVLRVILAQADAVATVLGGVTFLIGAGGGLYWLAAAAIIGIVAGMIGAWVLLVEILR